MKKKILSLGLSFILVLGLSTMVYAEDSNMSITYDGSDELQYSNETAFETAFEDMLPGDTNTLNITLENTYDETVDFYMSTEVISAFEDSEGVEDGAYSVELYVTQDDETTIIYGSGDDAAYIGGDDEGLYDLNGSLNEAYLVATLEQGETAVVSLEITLDGESQGNEYMEAIADLQLSFYASYDDAQASVVTNTVYVTADAETAAQTGDNSLMATYIILITVCLSAVGSIAVIKGRRKHEQISR